MAARAGGPEIPDHHDPAGVRVRQRFEQDGVHRAEDRRRGADSERQCEYGDRREARRTQHVACAIAQILDQRFHKIHASCLAALLFGPLHSAKLQPRPPQGFPRRHAALNQVFRVSLHVKAQLRIHLAFHPRTPQRRVPPRTKPAPQPHTSSAMVPRISIIHASVPPWDPRAWPVARGCNMPRERSHRREMRRWQR